MRNFGFPLLVLSFLMGCNSSLNQSENTNNMNQLANEKSPYLLQHSDNPVNWYPWGEEALKKAKEEDKPIILSIGYSSCHWCHVMAHESFEDSTVAAVMNEHYINIKVDREERPDIDQIYMDAVQAMGLNGGWPLNVFLTPEQKPFYGGTYFPKEKWIALLGSVNDAFQNKRQQLNQSADKFSEALGREVSSKFNLDPSSPLTEDALMAGYYKMASKFDKEWGGLQRAPKFPLPSIWRFLYTLHEKTGFEDVKEHLEFTLDKIYQGGIYDHVGGGFARYSVDGQWHVPHFEKMLYDNGQLLSVYAEAYKLTKNPDYRRVISETIQWLNREMLHENGGFYAALDADSEGVEGKFYTWSKDEIMDIAGKDGEIICQVFDVSEQGNWEHTNVLRLLKPKDEILKEFGLTDEELDKIINAFKEKALKRREERIRPGWDNKLISGWNGLALTGLLDAYQAIGDESILKLAEGNYRFIRDELINDGRLLHVSSLEIQGFADDYAAVIQAFIKYYETVFDEGALQLARQLQESCIKEFFDDGDNLFYYTSSSSEGLIARKKEFFDNVIPASNSILAENLFKLGLYFDDDNLKTKSDSMLNQVSELVEQDLEFLSQWALLGTLRQEATPEIVIVGEKATELAKEFNALSLPNKVIMANSTASSLPLMEHKETVGGNTTIFVCFNKTCKLPVHSIEEALEQIP